LKIRNLIFILVLLVPRLAWADITINPNQPGGATYCSQPVILAPGFTMDASFAITGMKVSISLGYHPGEDELLLAGNTGPVTGYWSDAQGFLTLSGSSDINEYILAMRKVQYRNKSALPSHGVRTITFSLDDADYLPETKHFYKFINTMGISWITSKAEAQSAAMSYHGLQGYLATITSEAENAFIKLKTKGVGWIGASDQALEGEWRWVTGPEGLEDSGQGRLFWKGSGYQAKSNPAVYGPVNGNYQNWNRYDQAFSSTLATTTWEPNNSGGSENYAHITFFPSNPADSYKWNDLPNAGGTGDYIPAGYLIEYGGMPGDPVINLTADIALQVNSISFSANRIFTKCQGDPVQLNQQDILASYKWNPMQGLSNPLISNPSATPDVTTIYTVVATNGSCKDSAGFTVNVNPGPVSLLKKSENICVGKSVVLDPGLHTSYLWNSGSTSRTVTTGIAGKYLVKLTSSNGCQISDSVVVTIAPYPKIDLSGLNKLVCSSTDTYLKINKDKGDWLITNLTTNQKFTTPAIQVAAYGNFPFALKLTDNFGCSTDTTVTIGFHESAVVHLGNDTTICNPRSLLLDAGAGLTSYQWSTGETSHQIEVKKYGKYNVLVRNSFGCFTKDSINVSFTNKPKLNLSSLDTLTCGSRSATVNITADKGVWQFRSSDSSVTIKGMTVNVPVFGTYPFSFVSTDQYGCSTDTSFSIGFHKIPKVSFTIDESVCYGYNLKATYIGDANIPYALFTWVFGGDTISNNKGQNIESIPLGDGQIKRDLKLTVNDAGCSDNSSIKDIRVIPTLSMTVEKPLQCLPLDFDFKGFNTETGVVYEWDFGDGTGSIQKDVLHKYAKDGYYDVSLTVTTNKGCFNTMVKKKMVYVAPIPTVGFSIPVVKCLNPGKDTLNYAGSAGAEDTFHWNLKGFDPVEMVQSPDTTAGPFVFDLINKPKTSLSLHVTSQYGCLSDTVSLVVKRKPVFSFTSSVKDGCAPLPISFKASPDDPVDQLNFKWEYGDGEKGSGENVSHSYLIPNLDHDIGLSAVSSITGCTDSLLKPKYIVIHPVPKAGFEMDHDIVFNDNPKISFTDHSVNAVNYSWDFGDGLHSGEKDVVHSFDGAGVRKILQTVYNQFDCQDTTSKNITIVFNQLYPPNAFSPNSSVVVDKIFKLYTSGIVNEGYHLTIISRWNDVVFECKNEIKGWDGKMENGSYAPPGAYIWILECFDIIGRPHRQTGALTLVY